MRVIGELTALDHAEVQSPSQRSVSVVKQTLHQLAEELNVHGMKLGVEDEDEPPVVVDDEARALAREGSLREQLRTLEADHAMVLAELDEMRAVVAAAGAAHASPIDDMRADELRELVRRLRHDAEVMRMKSAMEARELLTRSLRTLDTSLTKEVRWTSDRLIRHTEARDMALLKDLHLEVAGLKKAMHKNLRIAVHSLRGRLLPTQPTELLATKLQGDLRKDQVRWLQGCCGVLFPHCLVCIFDPSSQDDVEHSPWTILEAIDEAHAAPLAAILGIDPRDSALARFLHAAIPPTDAGTAVRTSWHATACRPWKRGASRCGMRCGACPTRRATCRCTMRRSAR